MQEETKQLGKGLELVIHGKKDSIFWGIDLDSIIHQRGHIAIKNNETSEEAYRGILEKIYSMRGQVYKYLGVDRDRIVELYSISPKKTFRNGIYREYKIKRKPELPIITELKGMIGKRFNNRLLMGDNIEADDYIVSLSRLKSTIVSAIDKDVSMASSTAVHDYNIRRMDEAFSERRSIEQIEQWFIYQSIIGDSTDNIKGAKGVGKKGALDLLKRTYGKPHFHQWAALFEDENDAILNMQLVRTDQYDIRKGRVELWTKEKWKY